MRVVAPIALLICLAAGTPVSDEPRPGTAEVGPRAEPAMGVDELLAERERLVLSGVAVGPLYSPAPGVLVADAEEGEGSRRLEARFDPAGANAEVETTARRALAEWHAAYNRGDWPRVLELYADEPSFHWIEPGRGMYDSKAAIAAALEALYPSLERHLMTTRELSLRALSGRLVLAETGYRQEIEMSGGQGFTLAGTMTALLRLTPDGWRLTTGTSAAEMEPAADR